MQVSRTWTTEEWCRTVVDPQWPFAYSKFHSQTEERNGRLFSNLQDVRHECETRGVQSKCHLCKDIDCGRSEKWSAGRGNHNNQSTTSTSTCHFQLQGVSTADMSKNVPTVSDIPWAVGGLHRYDYGGQNVSHICLHMSGGYCQSNYGKDYSNCVVRCWGHSATLERNQHKPGPTILNYDATKATDMFLPTSGRIYYHDTFGVGPWLQETLPVNVQSWSYHKTN
jgi:hypothetical protein